MDFKINIFDKVFSIIKHNTEIRTQENLAMVLGITQPCISDARKRNVFPLDWLVKIALLYGMSLDSVLGLKSRPALSESVKVAELLKSMDESFVALKNYNQILQDNQQLTEEKLTMFDLIQKMDERLEQVELLTQSITKMDIKNSS